MCPVCGMLQHPANRTHIDTIFKFLPHPWCTHRISLVIKKNFFSFPVAVNNYFKVGPLVFLL